MLTINLKTKKSKKEKLGKAEKRAIKAWKNAAKNKENFVMLINKSGQAVKMTKTNKIESYIALSDFLQKQGAQQGVVLDENKIGFKLTPAEDSSQDLVQNGPRTKHERKKSHKKEHIDE